jgi:hypothetical protein
MKNLAAFILVCLLAGCHSAQEPLKESAYVKINSFSENENHQTLVFGDKINVRTAPNKDAQILTQLLAGEAVTVLSSDTAQLTQNGWTTNWVKIAFDKNGKRQEGYAWGGVLSFKGIQVGDVLFVYGVVKKSEDDTEGFAKYEIEIRAVRKNQIISSVKTEIGMESAYDTQAFLFGDLGLRPYKNVLSCQFTFGACDYPQYEVPCLWDGSKLALLPTLLSVFNAGVFTHSESYLFPKSEGGISDSLLFQVEETEGSEGEEGYSSTHQVVKMNWNGKAWEKPDLENEDEGRE